jgi:hypothetical protein
MKKTILALLFLFGIAKAQTTLPVQLTVTIPTSSSGSTKGYVDSGDNALKSYVAQSLTNYRDWANNTFALKGTTGTSTGAIGLPSTVNLPSGQWLLTIIPTNYGKVYSNNTTQGKYTIAGFKDNTVDGAGNPINFSTKDREDKVFTIAAYNPSSPNSGREFANESAWDETVETHYDNSGFIPYGDFEWHQRVYTTMGHELRNSWYVSKTTGASRRDWSANMHQFYLPKADRSNFLYGVLSEAHWDLYASTSGRIVGYWATDWNGIQVGIKEIGGEGFIEVPGFISYTGYGSATIILPNSATGLVKGQAFWITLPDGTEVITRVK